MIGYCWAFECSLIRWYWIVCSILVRIDKPRKPEKLKKPIRKVQNCQKKSCQWTAGETESVPCSLSRSNWATPRSKIRPELRLTMRQGPTGPFLSPRVFQETSSISSSFICVRHIVGHSRVTYVQLGRVCVWNGSASSDSDQSVYYSRSRWWPSLRPAKSPGQGMGNQKWWKTAKGALTRRRAWAGNQHAGAPDMAEHWFLAIAQCWN